MLQSRTPTLPSLSLGIYRSNFLDSEKYQIPNIIGNLYLDLVKGYFGGHVDVYHPISEPDKKIYHYDVNSLYPYAMVNYPMPTGNPTYFEGDIRKEDPKAFGFFYVKVTAPDNLKVPILLTKNNINITMAPTGTWKGLYFSEELLQQMQKSIVISLKY